MASATTETIERCFIGLESELKFKRARGKAIAHNGVEDGGNAIGGVV